jgi:ubiquitin carboxyl-terminal hydrolase 25/28
MAAARITDRPDQADACKKAVGIIAGARRSETLQTYLATGGVSNDFADDEATAAYRFFDIQDRAADIDFDVMETIMNLKVSDEPHREAEIQRYFNILLQQRAGDAGNASTQQDFNTPVGLSNMGNTCYLNCLLQYFFTIKPLREVILDFDNHKMDTSAESFVPKKVGGRDISRTEVIKAQECMTKVAPYLLPLC